MLTRTRTSDVKAYRACPRAWWYRTVAKLPQRRTAAMTRGTMAHIRMERWTTGEAPDALDAPAARVFANELTRHFQLPAGAATGGDKGPWAQVLPEWSWSLAVSVPSQATPIEYTGCADLVLIMAGEFPVLLDFKTRGSEDRGRRFAPTAEQLRTDVQLLVYAWAILRLLCGDRTPGGVHAAHMNAYHNGKGQTPVPELVPVTLEREAIEEGWLQVVLTVDAMAVDSTKTSAEQVRADISGQACTSYGGCPYRHRCSQYAHMQALPAGDPTMALAINPVARPTAPAATAPAAPAAEPVAAVAPTPQTTPAASPAPADSSFPFGGLEVCIDTVPMSVDGEVLPIVDLAVYLAPLVDKVCELKKVTHYGAIPYSEGKAMVAQFLAVNLPPAGSIVLVDSGLPLSPACLEVLLPKASRVYRGLR